MNPADLIETAIALAGGRRPPGRGQPGQTDLRRALSTIYYAAFHALANNNADSLVGTTAQAQRDPAWTLAYRAIDHRAARERCQAARVARFPREIREMADLFIRLQTGRNQADYAPEGQYSRFQVMQTAGEAERTIADFKAVNPEQRRPFAAHILFRERTE